eukprot:gene6518-10526_t
MKQLLLVLLFFSNFFGGCCQLQEIGCLLWDETFLRIHKNIKHSSQDEYIFTVHTRQWNGYIGVGIFSKPNFFDDSTSIIAYLPNNFIQLKNHTKQMKKKTIFGESFQGKYDTLDGTYTFGFIMNSSDLIGKNYFAFSKNENSNPLTINGSIIIPKHYTFSKYYHLQLNSTNNLKALCREGLNIAARITAFHPAIFLVAFVIHVLIALLYLTFMNHQPFKSRFFGPYIALSAVHINLIMEFILTIRSYEASALNYCIDSILFSYGPLQAACSTPVALIFRYIVLLKIHNNKRKFIKLLRMKSSRDTENMKRKDKRTIFRKRFLSTISSPWTIVLVPIIWTGIYLIFSFSVYAGFNFQCSTDTFIILRFIFIGMFGFCILVIASLILFDFLTNIRYIVVCKWKKIFFEDDPFNFRLDMIAMICLTPPLIVWSLVTLPKIIYAIFTDILMYLSIWSVGFQALLITMLNSFLLMFRKSKSKEKNIKYIHQILEPGIVDVFVEFCESEWSLENILFKLDVIKYKNSKSKSERKQISLMILNKYLISNMSELEINATNEKMVAVGKLIENEELDDELFQGLESIVNVNLADTISRFQFSYMYESYLKSIKKKEKSLGL